MKRVLLFLLIFIPFWVNGQGFRKYYPNIFESIATDESGNIYTYSYGDGTGKDGGPRQFLKFNSKGKIIYSKETTYINNIFRTSDNCFLSLTYDYDTGKGYSLRKVDTLGNTLWEKALSPSYQPNSMIEDAQKNILIGGCRWTKIPYDPLTFETNHINDYQKDLTKVDSAGNLLWTKSFPFYITAIENVDNGYMIAGYDSPNSIISKLNSDGDTIFSKKNSTGCLLIFKQTSDGNYIGFNLQSQIVKFNKNGDPIWTKSAIKLLSMNIFLEVYQNGFYISGYEKDKGVVIVKFDLEGNIIWDKAISLLNFYNQPFSLKRSVDETIIASCTTSYGGRTVLLKLDKNGNTYTNSIRGRVLLDSNGNCSYNTGEPGFTAPFLQAIGTEDSQYAIGDEDGYYNIPVDTGISYLVSPIQNRNGNTSNNCIPIHSVTFNKEGKENNDNNFFLNQIICPRLNISNIISNRTRCFTGKSKIVCSNTGNQKAEGIEVIIEVPANYFLKETSSPYTSLANNIFKFNIGSLNANQDTTIILTDSISCTSNLGDLAYIRTTVYSSSQCQFPQFLRDTSVTRFTINGSYDPNDKQVFPSKINYQEFNKGTKELDYLIRFQNTGNGEAYTVKVIDTLNSDLELNSIRKIKASHPYSIKIIKSTPAVIEWFFENINLPYQSQSEALSQGFISFAIDLKEGLEDKTTVSNGAAIYFDYNEPVITNRAATLISSEEETETYKESIPTGTQMVSSNHSIIMFPNPITESSVIRISPALNAFKTAIYDSKAIKLLEKDGSGDEVSIHRNELKAGIYFYHIYTENQEIGKGSFLVK
ncbi:MAG: T9SS type A sorting domain-containing protein [Sporocytophaga sp.]|nr:T9SS type A sorting domain-containing protein [Sporocytophaga sp.]